MKRVQLDGDVVILRVVENGALVDRVFVRDASRPRSHDVWVQQESWRSFIELYPEIDKTQNDRFEEAWNLYPSRPGRSKADARKAWNQRIKAGTTADVMVDGVRRYASYCAITRTEPQYIKQPATFFGPGLHFLSDWTVPAFGTKPLAQVRIDTISALTGARRERQDDILQGRCERVA